MSNSPDDACSIERNHGAQKEIADRTGFYFALLNALQNIRHHDELIQKGLLQYFLFDVR